MYHAPISIDIKLMLNMQFLSKKLDFIGGVEKEKVYFFSLNKGLPIHCEPHGIKNGNETMYKHGTNPFCYLA